MENSNLYSPEADSREATQFLKDKTDFDFVKNQKEQIEISLNTELKSSVFASRVSDGELVALHPFQRDRHVYFVGATGSGKSTALECIVIHDIDSKKPGMFLDPHGDSARNVLRSVKRTRKIVYLDLSDTDYQVGFNPIAGYSIAQAPKVASDFIASIKDIFFERDFNAPRFSEYLWNHLVPLVERKDSTLFDLLRMLSDKDYRESIVRSVRDPLCAFFWTTTYPSRDKKYNTEAVGPIANKLPQILSNVTVRNVLCQKTPKFDMKRAFDEGYFVVVNLAKGKIGNEAASFLGSLLIAHANNILMERDKEHVVPTPITADEFQNFAVDIVASMLSEIRKKGGQLTPYLSPYLRLTIRTEA